MLSSCPLITIISSTISSTHSCCWPCCPPIAVLTSLHSHHCNLIATFLLLPSLPPLLLHSHHHTLVTAISLLLPLAPFHCCTLIISHDHILITALSLPCYPPPLPSSSSSFFLPLLLLSFHSPPHSSLSISFLIIFCSVSCYFILSPLPASYSILHASSHTHFFPSSSLMTTFSSLLSHCHA